MIWIVGFGGFLWNSETSRVRDFLGMQYGMCSMIRNNADEGLKFVKDEQEVQRRLEFNETQKKACDARASAAFFSQSAYLREVGVAILLAFDLGTVLFGWLVVWLVVVVVRWVQRGFSSA